MVLRSWLIAFACWNVFASVTYAQEKPHFDKSGELTEKDPRDPANPRSHFKMHEVKLQGERVYRIDLMSKDFDTLLRLEDANGGKIASDDDGAGDSNSRLILAVPRDGVYRLIVSSSAPSETGKYTLVVKDPSKNDLFAMRARQFQRLDNAGRVKLLEDAVAHFEERGKTLTSEDGDLAFELTFALEGSGMRGVGDWCLKMSRALAAGDSERIRGLSKMIEGVSRRLRLAGNPLALSGTLLDGKKLDWASYKGKVVLVDFWATWCGPCVKEMPNLKRLYEGYKGKGFDIVGVSIDHDGELPARFMAKGEYPWACIFEKGMRHQPLADYYGVMSIPLAILVGRDGKVIATDARGPELERLLEQQLGPIPEKK
jgi:thiol-disulfide isomerase/thioredoxin